MTTIKPTAQPSSQGQSSVVLDEVEENETTKKSLNSQKKLKTKPTVIIESSNDSDIEEIKNPKESPEEEVGKFSFSILMA